jgi:hypothetical protein
MIENLASFIFMSSELIQMDDQRSVIVAVFPHQCAKPIHVIASIVRQKLRNPM